MLFAGKKGPKPEQIREEKSLYPVLHVAGSLKDYQKELVQKEVSSGSCVRWARPSPACCGRRTSSRRN